ncbi:uncharacterized protein [Fopius arisanus]|nr:PREDICTED: uncharacterized protein LOC105265735 isoform X2 [Fopius arisanus]
MEDDEFGFTRRNDKALNRVKKLVKSEEQEVDERSVGNPRAFLVGDGTKGVAEGGTTSPETGSHRLAHSQRNESSGSSVARETPDIPNVVEYHLKVQSSGAKRNPNKQNIEMRTDISTPLSSREKTVISKLSRLSIDNNVFEGSNDLPQVFQVKYLGSHDARGLWGIKHTRKPVDNMVAAAKSLPTDTILPLVKLVVSKDGVALLPLGKIKGEPAIAKTYTIETISYGVQDLVYTRVFSMIVVRDSGNFRKISPFECHAFVCESKHHARQLTYALATAFQIYSQMVKALGKAEDTSVNVKKRFAIDLRTPDEIETDLARDSEA